jgi:hypothetical protein
VLLDAQQKEEELREKQQSHRGCCAKCCCESCGCFKCCCGCECCGCFKCCCRFLPCFAARTSPVLEMKESLHQPDPSQADSQAPSSPTDPVAAKDSQKFGIQATADQRMRRVPAIAAATVAVPQTKIVATDLRVVRPREPFTLLWAHLHIPKAEQVCRCECGVWMVVVVDGCEFGVCWCSHVFLQVYRRIVVSLGVILIFSAIFFLYFSIILLQSSANQQSDTLIVYSVLSSALILLTDFGVMKIVEAAVVFEKHFTSIGRNWKRITYLAVLIILNNTSVILAYCASPAFINIRSNDTGFSFASNLSAWSHKTYQQSFGEWQRNCSSPPYTLAQTQTVVNRLGSVKDVDVAMLVGYWYYFTSQSIDGYTIPALACQPNDNNDLNCSDVGCSPQTNFSCDSYSRSQNLNACQYIMNMASDTRDSPPNIYFSAAVYDLPWSQAGVIPQSSQNKFRLSSYAYAGSLYSFLFSFILLKAVRMVVYYLYNDIVSILSQRLILPIMKRSGVATTTVSCVCHNFWHSQASKASLAHP